MSGTNTITFENVGDRAYEALQDFWSIHADDYPRRCCIHPNDAKRLFLEALTWGRWWGRAENGSFRMEIAGCKVLCTPRAPIGSLFFE